MYIEADFLVVIENAYSKYLIHDSRSPEKIKPIHKFWAELLVDIFGKNYQFHYNSNGIGINPQVLYKIGKQKGMPKGEPFKELSIQGKYYPKNVDVTLTNDENKPVFCLGIKFITSNFEQNRNNYFEGMLGETVNIQGIDVPYAHLIIFRKHTPYYKKEEGKRVWERTETLGKTSLDKYWHLNQDIHPIKPFAICLYGIDIKDDKGQIIEDDFIVNCQNPTCEKVEISTINPNLTELSIDKFLEKIQLKANEVNGITL